MMIRFIQMMFMLILYTSLKKYIPEVKNSENNASYVLFRFLKNFCKKQNFFEIPR